MQFITNVFLAFFCASMSFLFALLYPLRRWKQFLLSTDVHVRTRYNQRNILGLTNGCMWSLLAWMEVLVVFILEPSCVIWALVEPERLHWLAYGVFCIIVLRASLVYSVFSHPRRGNTPIWMSRYWVLLWVLPSLYFWYFFLVMLGLVR